MGRPAPVADWVTIPDLYQDPFPIYERLRAEGGVHWVPAVGRYLITSYEAVHTTEFDQEIFSANEEGSLQIRAMGHSMLRRDDPEHYLERKAWQPALRPGAVKRTWTRMFERNADRYLDEMIAKGPGADLIWDFAAPYSAENLREIIGLYNADQSDLQRWSQTMIDATGNYADDPEVWARGKQSFDEVDIALDEMLHWHAKNPDDSLLSSLLRIPDYQMPLEKIRANVKMTIGGGLNEPRDAIGVAAWAMLTHPEQRAAVARDPGLWPTVFDETIRWVAPIGMYSRQVTRETELAGVTLPTGARLGICILSANRDETLWEDAQSFDIFRQVKPHLAFSKGVHVCLGAWVARAEVAAVGLPKLFERVRGLQLHPERPAHIGGWVFRGMLDLPVTWDAAATAELPAPVAGSASSNVQASPAAVTQASALAPRVAIVGSGPAGCFTAQAIHKRFPQAKIDVFDRLPVPYGLLRYGVAADHQGTKSISRQFDRLFLGDNIRFHGGVNIGSDITVEELRGSFDAVVLASGLREDARLDIQGADLEGVHGAGQVTRKLNGHPDEHDSTITLGESVLVVGHGNVALDAVRLIARDDLDGTDLDTDTHAQLTGAVRTVHVVGRSAPEHAKFDPVMMRELAGLPGISHQVHGVNLEAITVGKDARLDAVHALSVTPGARLTVHWWFESSPTALLGDTAVRSVELMTADGPVTVQAGSVITAIGFAADASTLVVPGEHASGRIDPGYYVAGWLRRGPRGTIPDQRADSRDLALALAQDIDAGSVPISASGIEKLNHLVHRVDFDGWRRIDVQEKQRALPGRTRAKFRSFAELVSAASDMSVVPSEADHVEHAAIVGGATGVPVTVLFGTESGNAELVAEGLSQHLGGGSDVLVEDLSEFSPDSFESSRLYLVLCSSYGDGELPTNVRAFHDALTQGTADLSHLNYAVFGLGDRSYTKTYSRGSELLDEALSARGASRVGEYGRHDASGPLDATDVAQEWANGVLTEYSLRGPAPLPSSLAVAR
ncbi:cytochrome P450 [Leucobacter salsicius]|uniref:cytochrome P450 n=1 Tax=Leucobacter salsicius TaxID=664638 RepID=UPI0003822606|nr:cytochrome P450 [Leucobacter salsicius]